MQKIILFENEQNYIWHGSDVDYEHTCTKRISFTGSKGLDGRCTETGVTIFAGGVN